MNDVTKQRPLCAACRRSFDWDEAYQSQNTPGSATHNPPGHGVFRPRAYCPHCGALVAEWHIDRYKDYNQWTWVGENTALNSGTDLPPNPLLMWGKSIPVALLPTIDEDRLAVDKIKQPDAITTPKEPQSPPQATRLARQASLLLDQGELEKALQVFEQASAAGLNRHEFAFSLGAVGVYYLYKRSDVANAFRYCLRSLELDHTANWQAHYILSLIYSAAGETEKAGKELSDAQRFARTLWWEPDFERSLQSNLQTWLEKHGKTALRTLLSADTPSRGAQIPEGSKVCPNCGNVIKLEAVLCRFCKARFEVVEKGYCSTCHKLVVPAPDGKCPTCHGELLDRRITSQLVQEAAPPPTAPLIAQVTCHKCRALNPSGQKRCQSCNANLLPGEGIFLRSAYFIAGVVLAALAAWLLKGVIENSITLDLMCLKPGFLVVGGGVALVYGIYKMVSPTPQYTRYANRASRHMDTNLPQALADIDAALAIAPKGERPGLMKKRQEINTRLGDNQGALRDQLELALDPETHRSAANIASMLNLGGDDFANNLAKQDRQALLESGKVHAFGYCKRCKAVVELNTQLKCPQHGGVSAINYAISGEEGMASARVMSEVERQRHLSRRRRIIALVTIILLIGGCYLVSYLSDRPSQTSQLTSLPAAQINPETSVPLAEATSTSTVALQEVSPILFSDHQVSFEYPSSWEIINEAGVQTLLRGSLEGIGDWEYIGGVYTKAPDDCVDCAQITVTIIPLPQDFPGWSDEFYERIKQNAQSSMGDRLQLHRQVKLGDYPGWEAMYLGKSGRTKIWDQSYIPSGESVLVMVSASASPDQFDLFKPVFEQAFSTLSLYGASKAIN